MAVVYLHIGMPKTGTTYIQKILANNNEVLNKKGYIYPSFSMSMPNVSKERNGNFLIPNYKDEKGKRIIEKEMEAYNRCFPELVEFCKEYDNVILSDEMIWIFKRMRWGKFKSDLDKAGIQLKVLVYLRRQDLFCQSYWSQLVKLSRTFTFEEFLKDEVFCRLNTDYYKKISSIAEIVGKENIIVRPYEKQQFGGRYKTLLSDFLETVGLGDIDEEKDFAGIKDQKFGQFNPSLTGAYLEVKRYLNNNPVFRIKNSYVTNLLYSVMQENSGLTDYSESKYMTYDQQVEFLSRYEEGNNKIAEEYMGGNGGSLFKDDVPKREDGSAETYNPQELLDVCGKVIEKEYGIFSTEKNKCVKIKKINKEQQKEIDRLTGEIRKLNSTIKSQKATINWMSASFLCKVKRKLKRMIFYNSK